MAVGTEPYTKTDRYTPDDSLTDRRDRRGEGPSVRSVHQMESGSFGESIAGAGGVVLAILGLIGLLPAVLGSIAVMAVGVGLFLGGGVIAGRARRLDLGARSDPRRRQIMGGLGMEAFAGGSGAVLGLLALLGVSSVTLLGVSAIVLGGALLMASAATSRLETAFDRMEAGRGHPGAHDALYVASGSDVLIGIGAVVLGILALAGQSPVTLDLVAMLSVGAAVMLSGSAFATRVLTLFGV